MKKKKKGANRNQNERGAEFVGGKTSPKKKGEGEWPEGAVGAVSTLLRGKFPERVRKAPKKGGGGPGHVDAKKL